MKQQVNRAIKIISALMFLSILLLLPQFLHPHMILAGVFFLEGADAALILSFMLAAVLIIGYFVLRSYRKSYYPLLVLYLVIGTNAGINLLFATLLKEDMEGFFERLFAEPGFLSAFVVDQFALAFLSALIMLYAWSNRRAFSRL